MIPNIEYAAFDILTILQSPVTAVVFLALVVGVALVLKVTKKIIGAIVIVGIAYFLYTLLIRNPEIMGIFASLAPEML